MSERRVSEQEIRDYARKLVSLLQHSESQEERDSRIEQMWQFIDELAGYAHNGVRHEMKKEESLFTEMVEDEAISLSIGKNTTHSRSRFEELTKKMYTFLVRVAYS